MCGHEHRRGSIRFLTASASGFTPFSIMEMQMDRVRRSRWQFCVLRIGQLPFHSARCREVVFFGFFSLSQQLLTRMVAISWRISTACWAAACFSVRSLGGILETDVFGETL